MGEKISPAQHAISIFGGVSALARAVGRSRSAVCQWQTETGGKIPRKAAEKILEVAQERGLDITLNDLYFGRKHD